MEHVEAHSMRLLGTLPAGGMKSAAVHFQPGDVLYGRLRPYLNKVYRPEFEGLCSAEFIVLAGNEVIEGRFLQYLLNSELFVSFATQLNAGDRPRVDFGQLAEFRLPLPPMDEQRRIVAALEEHLSRLDAAVAGLKRVEAQLPRYRAAVLNTAVGNDHTGMASGWSTVRLEEVARIASGNTPAGITEAIRTSGELPWFRVGDMNTHGNEVHLTRSTSYLTRDQVSELGLRVFPPGTFVFPKRGGAIATGKKRILAQPSCIDLNTMAITPRAELASYLWLWLLALDLSQLSDGSNVPQINHKDVKPLMVRLPPVWERARLAAEADRLLTLGDSIALEVKAALARAARMRQAILKQAFEGKLVPQDPNDEPADRLLARIRAEREAEPAPRPKARPPARHR